jgi:ABC-type bacteriocin/lantibiotic exporter with double-glycine peptidase domain
MHGKQVDYNLLVDQLNLTDKGANVAELVRVAEVNGLSYTALRADANAISKLPLPAIAHFHNPGDAKGHYVVLLSANGDESFTIIECTRGKMEHLPKGDFLNRWSGVILVNSRLMEESIVNTLVWGSSGILFALLLIGFVHWKITTRAPAGG